MFASEELKRGLGFRSPNATHRSLREPNHQAYLVSLRRWEASLSYVREGQTVEVVDLAGHFLAILFHQGLQV